MILNSMLYIVTTLTMYVANIFTLYIVTTVRQCSRVGYALMRTKKMYVIIVGSNNNIL